MSVAVPIFWAAQQMAKEVPVGRMLIAPFVNLTSLDRGIKQYDNIRAPTVPPGIPECISGFIHGNMSAECFHFHTQNQGVTFVPGGANPAKDCYSQGWNSVMYAMAHRPSHDALLVGFMRNLVDPNYQDKIWSRYYYDAEAVAATLNMYRHWPDINIIVDMYGKELLKRDDYLRYLRFCGNPTDETRKIIEEHHRGKPDPTAVSFMYQRGLVDQGQFTRGLKQSTGMTHGDIELYEQLTHNIPGASDLIRFSVRDAFSQDKKITDELDKEYKESGPWPDWLEAQGFGWSRSYIGESKGQSVYWPEKYWRSHWVLMAPGQAYQAYHQFRPNRLHLYNKEIPGIKPFEFDDLKLLLRTNDYLPAHREWLAGLSFPPPRLVDIRRMWFAEIINDDEFIEYMRDTGQTEENSRRIREAYREDKDRWIYGHRTPKFDKYDTALYSQIIESFRVGASTEGELRGTLLGLLKNPDAAEAVVVAEKLRKNLHVVKEFTKTVRKQFLTGEVLAGTALATLIDGGMNEQHARQLVSLWETSFDLPRKNASVAMIRAWFFAGIIDEDSIRMRLKNIGYSERDADLLMIDMRKKKEVRDAKESGRRGGSGGKQSNYETPAVIAKWFAKGFITEQTAKAKLNRLNVPEEDWDYWLETAAEPPE